MSAINRLRKLREQKKRAKVDGIDHIEQDVKSKSQPKRNVFDMLDDDISSGSEIEPEHDRLEQEQAARVRQAQAERENKRATALEKAKQAKALKKKKKKEKEKEKKKNALAAAEAAKAAAAALDDDEENIDEMLAEFGISPSDGFLGSGKKPSGLYCDCFGA